MQSEGFVLVSHEFESDSTAWGVLCQYINPVEVIRKGEHDNLWLMESELFVEGKGRYEVTITRNPDDSLTCVAKRLI